MSHTKNNEAADVNVIAKVSTINKLEYKIISTYIQYSKICNLIKFRPGKCFSGYLEHSMMIFFWLQPARLTPRCTWNNYTNQENKIKKLVKS